MSTPATFKKRDIAREKAAKREQEMQQFGLVPLSAQFDMGAKFPKPSYKRDAEDSKQKTEGTGGRASQKVDITVEVPPDELAITEYTIAEGNVICFSGRKNFLSNMFLVVVHIEGYDYPSVEHYYQAVKLYTLAGSELAKELRNISDPGRAKVFAKRTLRRAGVPIEKVEEWKITQGIELLTHAITVKYLQNEDLRAKLLETGDAILAHAYEHENIFATGCGMAKVNEWSKNNNGNILKVPVQIGPDTLAYVPLVGEGKNVLGFLNMLARERMRHVEQVRAGGSASDVNIQSTLESLHLDTPLTGDEGSQ